MTNICVLGQGYVGLSLAMGAAIAGHRVVGLDSNVQRIASLGQFKTNIEGLSDEILADLIQSGRYSPTTNLSEMENSDIVIIAVPTPLTDSRKPDLTFLELAAVSIANTMRRKALIVNESTSFPGTLRNFIKPIIESISRIDFEYVAAPERIDPSNRDWDLKNTPRVIGGLDDSGVEKAFNFYTTFCSNVHIVSSPEVAEASKLYENTFRQINIAFANEFSKIATALGFSTHEAINAASTKPFGFLPFYPGIGVGGHCIPIDPTYLSSAALAKGVDAKCIELANSINLSMVDFIIEKINNYLDKPVQKPKIQIAGIAYKTEVADLRESPALDLINKLRQQGSEVTWHDPIVKEWNGEISSPLISTNDLGLIVTPHRCIDFSIWKNSKMSVLDISSTPMNFGWPKFL